MSESVPEMSMYRDVKSFLRRQTRQLRWTMRNAVSQYPLYLPLARRRHPDRVVGEDTELVIEGFPRSSNTFAVTAFQLAQSRPVKLAGHLHASSHVIAAAKKGVPTLVLIRDPIDVITSYIIFRGLSLTVKQAFRYYIRFYACSLP